MTKKKSRYRIVKVGQFDFRVEKCIRILGIKLWFELMQQRPKKQIGDEPSFEILKFPGLLYAMQYIIENVKPYDNNADFNAGFEGLVYKSDVKMYIQRTIS